MKTLGKGIPTDKQIEHFTVGNDRELDLVLWKYDALGSYCMQNARSNGLLTELRNRFFGFGFGRNHKRC
jgi:argininosuccinate lyase